MTPTLMVSSDWAWAGAAGRAQAAAATAAAAVNPDNKRLMAPLLLLLAGGAAFCSSGFCRPQVGRPALVILEDVIRGTFEGVATIGQHPAAIRDAQRAVRVLLDDHDRAALRVDLLHLGEDFIGDLRRKGSGGLVEQQHARLG